MKGVLFMKIKPLLPSQREKKRYLVFEIISKNKLQQPKQTAHLASFSEISNAIWNSILTFAGQTGAARAGISVLHDKYDSAKQRGMIRVSHKMLDTLKAALTLIREINNEPVIFRSLGASGILKKAEEKYYASA